MDSAAKRLYEAENRDNSVSYTHLKWAERMKMNLNLLIS